LREVERKTAGNEVALDITPARKRQALAGVFASYQGNDFSRLFYLYIDNLENASKPYMEIPIVTQELSNLLEGRNNGSSSSRRRV